MLEKISVLLFYLVVNVVGNKKDLVSGKSAMSEHELDNLTKVIKYDSEN